MTSGIYQIKNESNGKIYIGSSANVEARQKQHFSDLRRGIHHSKKLQRAFNKYGAISLHFSLIETVKDSVFLLAREQFWLWRTNAYIDGYNSRPDVESNKGYVYTESARQNMRKRHTMSEEGKKAIRRARESLRGIPRTEEVKAKISNTQKGRVPPNKTNGMLGRKHKEESKIKMIKNRRPMSEQAKEALRARNVSRTGYKHSEESRKKMSDSIKLHYAEAA